MPDGLLPSLLDGGAGSAGTDRTTYWPQADRNTSVAALLRHAVRRETGLLRARLRHGPSRVQRLRLPMLRVSAAGRAKGFLAAGAVAFDNGATTLRELDDVLRAAEVTADRRGMQVGSGGVVTLTGAHGENPVLIRVAAVGHYRSEPNGPRPEGALVPRVVGSGTHGDLAWEVETLLPGARPRRLSAALEAQALAFLAELPRSSGQPVPLDLPSVLDAMSPQHATSAQDVCGAAWTVWSDVTPVLAHGDFWAGNLLATDEQLTGIVDWDASHARGVPGADLMHLHATERRRAAGRSAGEELLSSPWQGSRFRRSAGSYFAAMNLEPGDSELAALGVVWWAQQTAATLRRTPHLAEDERWLRGNVDEPLRALA